MAKELDKKRLNTDKSKLIEIITSILLIFALSMLALIIARRFGQETIYAIQVLTNFFIIASCVFIGFQAYLARDDYREKNRRASVEKAIELSKFFAENILNNFSYINNVYLESSLIEIIDKIEFGDINTFSNSELESLLSPEDIKKYNTISDNIPTEILIGNRIYLNDGNMEHILNELKKFKEATDPELKTAIEVNHTKEFNTILYDTINYLEYFSMSFNDKVANETTVYQSLHQVFITLIKMNYIFIAQKNVNEHDKYYTHIIDLFGDWKDRFIADRQEEKCKEDEIAKIQQDAEIEKVEIARKAKEAAEAKTKEKQRISKRDKKKK